MTTLPSTTNSQLPQRRTNLPAAGARPMPMSVAGEGQLSLSVADVWRIIRSNILLIIGMVIVFGVGGWFANKLMLEHMPEYTASGLVEVDRQPMLDPSGTMGNFRGGFDNNSLSIEQNTQAARLQAPPLWADVLSQRDSKIRQTNWFNDFKPTPAEEADVAKAKEDLARNLQVVPLASTKLIVVRMTTKNPEDAKNIVEGIVDRHINNEQTEVQKETYSRTASLERFKTRFGLRISELNRRISQQAEDLIKGGGSPTQNLGFNAKQFELNRYLAQKMEVSQQMETAKTMRDAMVEQLQAGQVPSSAQFEVDQDPTVLRYVQQLDYIDTQLLLNKDLGENHKAYKQLLDQQRVLQDKLDQRRTEVRNRAVDRAMSYLNSQFNAAQSSIESITEEINRVKVDLGALASATAEYLANVDELKVIRGLEQRVSDQLDTLNSISESQALNDIKWAQRPQIPDSPSFPNLRNTMALAVLAALALSIGIAFLRELTDTTVRSPRDLAKVGPMTLLGMIPHEDDDRQSTGVPMPLVMSQAPHSIIAEQFRQVRTRLSQSASLETTRTILVTSPGPGDGKTTVAVNIASGMALNGRRVLLVDANFRRPALHEVFGIANEAGFAACLDNAANLATAVQKTDVPNLDVLPSGERPANATELLESGLLTDFIDRANEDYDLIIFDSGPMLVVSETVALAPRVDGVITVVRARTNTRGLLSRMRNQLEQLKAEHLGVVLNAVRNQAGGYYNRNIKTYYAYQNEG